MTLQDIIAKKDRIRQLPPDAQQMLAVHIWRKFVRPKLGKLSPEDELVAQEQFTSGLLGGGARQLPETFGREKLEPTLVEKTAIPAYKGVLGAATGMEKMAGYVEPGAMVNRLLAEARGKGGEPTPLQRHAQDVERTLRGIYPEGYGEPAAGLIPTNLPQASELGGNLAASWLPIGEIYRGAQMARGAIAPVGASLLRRALARTATGAAAGAASAPLLGGSPAMGALGGAVLGPFGGKARPVAPAATEAAAGAPSAVGEVLPGIEQDLTVIAKRRFGKMPGELSPDELFVVGKEFRARQAAGQKAELEAQKVAKQQAKIASAQAKEQAKTAELAERQKKADEAKQLADKMFLYRTHTGKRTIPPEHMEALRQGKSVLEILKGRPGAAPTQAVAEGLKQEAPEAVAAVQAMSQLKQQAAPTVTKAAEGARGTGALAERAKDAERKAAERAVAATAKPGFAGRAAEKAKAGEATESAPSAEDVLIAVDSGMEAISKLPNGKLVSGALKKYFKQHKATPQEQLDIIERALTEMTGGG